MYDERGQAGGGPPQGAVLYDAEQNSARPVVDALARAGVRKTAELVPLDGKGDIPGADVQVIDRGDFKLALVVNLVAGGDARRVRLSLPIADGGGEWEVFDGVTEKRFCSRTGNRRWTPADLRHGIDLNLPYQERVLIVLRRIPADMNPWCQAPEVGVEMMTFSTFLAGYGVGGGTSRRMPKRALMSGFEKPSRGRRLCPRRRTVDRAAVGNVKMWNCGNVKVWKYENGLGLRQIPPRGARRAHGSRTGT